MRKSQVKASVKQPAIGEMSSPPKATKAKARPKAKGGMAAKGKGKGC